MAFPWLPCWSFGNVTDSLCLRRVIQIYRIRLQDLATQMQAWNTAQQMWFIIINTINLCWNLYIVQHHTVRSFLYSTQAYMWELLHTQKGLRLPSRDKSKDYPHTVTNSIQKRQNRNSNLNQIIEFVTANLHPSWWGCEIQPTIANLDLPSKIMEKTKDLNFMIFDRCTTYIGTQNFQIARKKHRPTLWHFSCSRIWIKCDILFMKS